QGALRAMARRLDPSGTNGGPFLGLNGVVVKSHGGADALGIASAIRLAIALGRGDFAAEIGRNLSQIATVQGAGQPARASA
ncbi:MAG TPA: phosphate acyltransferase, partial [Caulobacteraceae bacterium]